MNVRVLSGLDNFFPGGVGFAVGDVVVNGVVEQHRVLRDDADGAAQAFLRNVANVLTIDGNAPGADFIKPKQQARERGFPRAARADDRNFAARRNLKIYVA